MHKIDLPAAEPQRIATQIQSMFELDPADILNVSAKTGTGVQEGMLAHVTDATCVDGVCSVLHAIIERVPPPDQTVSPEDPLKMLLFDSSSVFQVGDSVS